MIVNGENMPLHMFLLTMMFLIILMKHRKLKINTNYSRNFEGIDDIDCFKFNVTDLGKYNISVTGSSHKFDEI